MVILSTCSPPKNHHPPPTTHHPPPTAHHLQVYEQYVVGMLTNLESLPLDRIHNMLKMFVQSDDGNGGYDRTEQARSRDSSLSIVFALVLLQLRINLYSRLRPDGAGAYYSHPTRTLFTCRPILTRSLRLDGAGAAALPGADGRGRQARGRGWPVQDPRHGMRSDERGWWRSAAAVQQGSSRRAAGQLRRAA